jgi:hypothetical protein
MPTTYNTVNADDKEGDGIRVNQERVPEGLVVLDSTNSFEQHSKNRDDCTS